MNRGGRAARSSAAQSLGGGDPRLRRNAQAQTTDADLGIGLTLDRLGRIALVLDANSPFFITEDGALAFRTGDGVEAAPGSPVRLRIVTADRSVEVTKDGIRARPTASQVKTAAGVTVEAALVTSEATATTLAASIATLEADKAESTDLTDLDARVVVVETYAASHNTAILALEADVAALQVPGDAVADSAAGTPADLPEAITAIGVLEDKINELLASLRASGQIAT